MCVSRSVTAFGRRKRTVPIATDGGCPSLYRYGHAACASREKRGRDSAVYRLATHARVKCGSPMMRFRGNERSRVHAKRIRTQTHTRQRCVCACVPFATRKDIRNSAQMCASCIACRARATLKTIGYVCMSKASITIERVQHIDEPTESALAHSCWYIIVVSISGR